MTSKTLATAAKFRGVALFAVYFGVTVLLQILSGAYKAEFNGYPDESAHYVTSLMVRDFLVSGQLTRPMRFAQDFSQHYPKVAFGHWPPLFYALGGPWMLVFSPSRVSVLLGLAMLTTVLAWLTFRTAQRLFGWLAGAIAGLFLICLPVIQLYSNEVMAESLLAIVSLVAVIYFARYLDSERWHDSAMFALFAFLAIMTKGNGWDLALVPPIAILLTRRFFLITRWSLWLPAIIAGAACAPWQLMTMSLVQQGWGGGGKPSVASTLRVLRDFVPVFLSIFGWGLALLLILGVVVTVALPYTRKTVKAEWATMFALLPVTWIFHSIVPTGAESRRLVTAVPAMILFLFAGGAWLARYFRWHPAWVAAAAALVFALQIFTVPAEVHYGYIEAARFVHRLPDLQTSRILVSSERGGEGMFVSELAMEETRPGHQILRATKVLSRTDWNGNVFACFYRTPEQILEYLKNSGIGIVVSDTLPPLRTFECQRVLLETAARYPDRLKLIGSFRGDTSGSVNIYRVDLQ